MKMLQDYQHKFYQDRPANEEVATDVWEDYLINTAVQVYVWAMPAMSMEGYAQGMAAAGLKDDEVALNTKLPSALTRVKTPNQSTLYAWFIPDLTKGPVVLDLRETRNINFAQAGLWAYESNEKPFPFKGINDKPFLVIPGGWQGDVPKEGYSVVYADGYRVFVAARVRIDQGVEAGVADGRKMKYYYWNDRNNLSEKEKYVKVRDLNAGSLVTASQIEPQGMAYWQMLNDIIQREDVGLSDRKDMMMLGLAKMIGIEKGKAFAPNAKMKKVLEIGARKGWEVIQANEYSPSSLDKFYGDGTEGNPVISKYYEGTQWYSWSPETPNVRFEEEGNLMIPLKRAYHHRGALTFPHATNESFLKSNPGFGSHYLLCSKDKNGEFFDGSKTYKLVVPANPPAKDFWSLTVYETFDASPMRAKDALNFDVSSRKGFKQEEIGTTNLYVGPGTAPEGYEKNFIKTDPQKGFFVYFRHFGPEEAYWNKSYTLNDFEVVK
jgi:hypothetical protein